MSRKLIRGGVWYPHYDLLIAAQALRRGARLIIANMRESMRIPGLNVNDWVL
jgi:predicted nucleic acid-binding protein